jgi:hypothetical protein
MRTQYTVINPNVPGRPVVIRTHDREIAKRWTAGYRVTPRTTGRISLGLRRMERHAQWALQYDLFGSAKNPGTYCGMRQPPLEIK